MPACPRGQGLQIPFRGRVSCLPCPITSYNDRPAGGPCLPCPEGTRTNATGATSLSQCLPCPKGTGYRRRTSRVPGGCRKCTPGFFNDGSFVGCRCCPPGSYATDGENCVKCPENMKSSRCGEECKPCREDEEAKGTGNTICRIKDVVCPKGHFEDKLGACRTCQPGEYYAKGKKQCIKCAQGLVSSGGLQRRCTRCAKGKEPDQFQTECVCKPGSALQVNGECMKCPKGMFNYIYRPGQFRGRKNSPCQPCPRGTYSNIIGAKECKPCPPGQTQPKEGQTKCMKCEKGYRVRQEKHVPIYFRHSQTKPCVSVVTNCPKNGKRVLVNGFFSRCELSCPKGEFEINDRCDKCPFGLYYDPTIRRCRFCIFRRKGCQVCGNNQFRDPYTDKCKCENGYGATQLSPLRCAPCKPGTAVFQADILGESAECKMCPAGTFGNGAQANSCDFCARDTFTDMEGQRRCKKCPKGTKAYGVGETQCLKVGEKGKEEGMAGNGKGDTCKEKGVCTEGRRVVRCSKKPGNRCRVKYAESKCEKGKTVGCRFSVEVVEKECGSECP